MSDIGSVGEVVKIGTWAEMDVAGRAKDYGEEIVVVGAEDSVGADGGSWEGCGRGGQSKRLGKCLRKHGKHSKVTLSFSSCSSTASHQIAPQGTLALE